MTSKHRGRRKTRAKKPYIIGGIVFVSLAAVAAAFILLPKLIQKQLTPQETIDSYFQKLSKKQYKDMYGMLSDSAKKDISEKNFVARNKNIYEGIDAVKIKIETADDVQTAGTSSAVLPVTYKISMQTSAGALSFGNELNLVKGKGDEYKINWTDAAIFPNLEETDKVKVTADKASRGTIYDRNHTPLAQDGMVAEVGVVPGKLGDDRESVVKIIAEVLGITPEDIDKALSASWVTDGVFVPVKKINASDEELQARLVGEDGVGGIPGVAVNHVGDRVYPLGIKAGHLTGYIQTLSAEELEKKKADGYREGDKIGKAGLEKAFEEELRGSDGAEIYIADENGNKKETLCFTSPQGGKDVTVTIDAEVQQNVYDQFSQDAGAAVSMNPKTGELLALASLPGYDPNEFVLGMSKAKWEELNNNPLDPLTNRYNNAWVPGSSFKPVTAAVGIDSGKINPEENKGNVGLAWQKDTSWGDYKVTTLTDYGPEVNLMNALVYSDNIYFARAALDIGADEMAQGLKKFGFNEELPVELKLQPSTFAKDDKIATDIQLADTGYGQGQVLANPVHLASIYSAFVNEGSMIQPVIRHEEQMTGKIWKENVMTKEAADIIKNDLIQVIENPRGTGASAKIDGVSLLGKTGTAETKSGQGETGAKEYGWFACETADDTGEPIAVIAMVEDIQSKGVKHYVNDKVKNIIEQYMQ